MPHMQGHWGWQDPNQDKQPVIDTSSHADAVAANTAGTGAPIALRPTFGSPSFFGSVFSGSGGAGSMDPYLSSLMGFRGTGGTGGGSQATEGNMDANELIALSEFLGENVTSFAGGGKMHNPYKYNHGGYWKNLVNQSAAMGQINNVLRANEGMKMKRYDEGGKKSDEKGLARIMGPDFDPNDPMGIKRNAEKKKEAQEKKQEWLDSLAKDDPRRPENKPFNFMGNIPPGWTLPKGDGPFGIRMPGTWSLKDLRPNPMQQAMYDAWGYTPNPYLSSIKAPWEGQSAAWKRNIAAMRGEEYDYYDPAFYETSDENPWGFPYGINLFKNKKKANKGMKMKKRYTQGGRF